MKDIDTVKKGMYKHFKGHECKVIGVALHTETLEKLVVYIHKTEENPEGYWARPLDMFLGEKELDDGTKVKRFEFMGEEKETAA